MNNNITNEPFSCSRDGLTIRGHIYHAAQIDFSKHSSKTPVIILSHGFLGDETQLFTYAESLAGIGYTAVTFDFNGGGPRSTSSGKSVDMTVLTEKADLLSVIKYVETLEYTDNNNISLMGCSQGGFVSALTAAELKDRIKQLVLFFPALCIPDDARKGEMLVMSFDPDNIPPVICQEPMTIGRDYALTAQKLDVYKEIAAFTGRTLIIHGTEDKVVNIEYSRKAKNIYKNVVLKKIEGADHGFAGKDDEEAIRTLLDFCKFAE
ncbi:MAG: alpha/beta fold hydrolase [Treponemataceae bacterium]|nr:alpha/beta fold hydrolase [Treponemataceae bacterium]